MTFPEKEIFTALVDRIKSHEAYINDRGHIPPMHYDFDREQYIAEKDKEEFPFNRPAIFVRFGEMEYTAGSGFNKRGNIPVEVIVVQDKYSDSADGMESQPDFLKLLEYKYIINTVLDNYFADCIGSLNMTRIRTDHENRNLHVERLLYTMQITLTKQSLT
jgi:hypothetical protein